MAHLDLGKRRCLTILAFVAAVTAPGVGADSTGPNDAFNSTEHSIVEGSNPVLDTFTQAPTDDMSENGTENNGSVERGTQENATMDSSSALLDQMPDMQVGSDSEIGERNATHAFDPEASSAAGHVDQIIDLMAVNGSEMGDENVTHTLASDLMPDADAMNNSEMGGWNETHALGAEVSSEAGRVNQIVDSKAVNGSDMGERNVTHTPASDLMPDADAMNNSEMGGWNETHTLGMQPTSVTTTMAAVLYTTDAGRRPVVVAATISGGFELSGLGNPGDFCSNSVMLRAVDESVAMLAGRDIHPDMVSSSCELNMSESMLSHEFGSILGNAMGNASSLNAWSAEEMNVSDLTISRAVEESNATGQVPIARAEISGAVLAENSTALADNSTVMLGSIRLLASAMQFVYMPYVIKIPEQSSLSEQELQDLVDSVVANLANASAAAIEEAVETSVQAVLPASEAASFDITVVSTQAPISVIPTFAPTSAPTVSPTPAPTPAPTYAPCDVHFVPNAADQPCLEGLVLMHGGNCTPQCNDGYLPPEEPLVCSDGMLNFTCTPRPCTAPTGLALMGAERACAEGQLISSGGSCTALCGIGYEPIPALLECSFGVLDPPAFQCGHLCAGDHAHEPYPSTARLPDGPGLWGNGLVIGPASLGDRSAAAAEWHRGISPERMRFQRVLASEYPTTSSRRLATQLATALSCRICQLLLARLWEELREPSRPAVQRWLDPGCTSVVHRVLLQAGWRVTDQGCDGSGVKVASDRRRWCLQQASPSEYRPPRPSHEAYTPPKDALFLACERTLGDHASTVASYMPWSKNGTSVGVRNERLALVTCEEAACCRSAPHEVRYPRGSDI